MEEDENICIESDVFLVSCWSLLHCEFYINLNFIFHSIFQKWDNFMESI